MVIQRFPIERPKRPITPPLKEPIVEPPPPKGDEFLTPEQARGLGVELEAGWQLHVKETQFGREVSQIEPGGWEIFGDNEFFKSPEGKFFTAMELEREFAAPEVPAVEPIDIEQALVDVFPDVDVTEMFESMEVVEGMSVQEVDRASQSQEDFIDRLQEIGRTTETETILQQLGVPEEDVEAFFAPLEVPTVTEIAEANLEVAWGKFTEGDFSWGNVADVALGGLGVAGGYLEKYVGRPWEAAILEARSRFQIAIGAGTEFDYIAIRELEENRDNYGWAGALVSEEVSDIWHDYVQEAGIAKLPLQISEWLNPAYLIPIGGVFGLAARFTTKVPLLGTILQKTAVGVQAIERGITYPIVKPIQLGVKGVTAVGGRIAKPIADKLIKQADNLLLEIPITDDIINGALVGNWQRSALQAASKAPPVKAVIEKSLGWRVLIKKESMAVEDIVGKGAVAQGEIRRMGVNASNIKVQELRAISINPIRMMGFDKNAYSSMMANRLLPEFAAQRKLAGTLEHVFTKPEMYNMTSQQLEYVLGVREINTQVLNLLKAEGVPPEHLIEDWIHRVVEVEGARRKGIGRAIGARVSYEKHRKFKTMAEGIEWFLQHPEYGAHYSANPEILMKTYVQEAFKKIADERFVKYLTKEFETIGKEFGIKPSERLIQFPELFEEITGKAGRELAEKVVLRTEELTASKQFTGVLNRALRGEQTHPSTLAMLERKFPELGKRFREALDMSPVDRKIAMREIRDEVKALTEARKAPFWEAKTERAFRMEQLRQPGIKEGYVMQPFAGGKIYDQVFIDAFNKFFGYQAGIPGLQVASDAAGILRITKAALDFSQPAIQGLPSWGLAHSYLLVDPKVGVRLLGAWYKTFVESTAAFFKAEVLAKAIKKELPSAMERVRFGGSARAVDYFQVLWETKGLAGAFQRTAAKVPLKPYERAETAFFGAGELVRDRFWKILLPKATRQGSEFELARFLDRITGISDSAVVGVPLSVRQLEQTFAWFAPNYTRACLTVLADIFRGGFTGAEVRKALGGMVMAGAGMYSGVRYAIATLEGKSNEEAWNAVREGFGVVEDPITHEVEWKPAGRFMTVKVGNYNMGFGGFWYGLLRLTGNIMATVDEVGDRERIDLVRIMKHGTLNKQDNPFVYWWYTRSSPLLGTGFALASGKDFLGYPIETPSDYAKYIATRFEPIWMEQGINWMIPGMARDNEAPEDAARAALIPAEIFGMRTFPESQWVKFYDKANELIQHIPIEELDELQLEAWRDGKLTWKQLTDIQRTNLLTRYPELTEIYGVAQSDSAVRDSENWAQWKGRVDEEKDTYYGRGDNLIERLTVGDLDTRELREMWSDVGQNYGVALDVIGKEPTYEEIYAYFDNKEAKGEKYGFLDDLALQEYINIVFADYLDEKGDIDWDAKDRAIDGYIEKYGEDTYLRIRQMYADKKQLEGLDPTLIRLADDKDALSREYWQLPYKPIFEMDEDDEKEGNIPAEYLALWKQYQVTEDKEAFLEQHPELKKDWRAEFRVNNSEDDARLALWGYGGKLQSMAAYDLATQWARELGIPIEQLGLGLPPRSLVGDYFELNKIVAETSGSSVEARLFKLEHPDYLEWGLEQNIWKSDLSDESMDSLRIRVKNKDLTVEYEAIEKREDKERFLELHPQFNDDRRRVQMYKLGAEPALIEDYVSYGKIIDEFGANSAEARLFRFEHSGLSAFGQSEDTLGWDEVADEDVGLLRLKARLRGLGEDTPEYNDTARRIEAHTEGFAETQIDNYVAYHNLSVAGYRQERYLIEHPDFAQAMHKIKELEIPDRAPSEQYDILLEKEDKTPEDERRMEAYKIYFPENQIDTYVDWYENPRSGYEDDWFLMENIEFYDAMISEGTFKERRDFRKVPTRKVYDLYQIYLDLPLGQMRLDYRAQNHDLDAWLVNAKGYKPAGDRGSVETDVSAWEELAKEIADIEKRVAELRE